nr:bifunctional dethiobiotin synthetase/7,8-diamino-pelargonic acid aminotransferase, mitochondrial isoform X2 [Tanacetum cinerariifolium]
MFPENVYEPALECAELLLEEWAYRAYFSDSGSTTIEIALKMAFRKFLVDNELLLNISQENTLENSIELKEYHCVANHTTFNFPRVVAPQGSYYGDTVGVMDAQAPSPYTSFLQQPRYCG